ncbi:carbon-nitrogen hydrolase family protein [Selenomonas sp. TAMA-11512]|uniref:carbon-nitrogen hydrolase family protein n=1 Tax=Selenomonas sp. TAMA-11512 TaxID=3095337 RepID=UPI003093AF62|nr:carbon-nitrogen hydrolase family protein [Selenomonas sp. TAMA-11512]
MAHKWNVAAVQMDCVPYDKDANLRHGAELVADAASRGAQLVVLPELFNTGYRVETRDTELAESLTGRTSQWMQDTAQRYGIYLAGALLERGEDGLVYDTAVLVGAEGLIGRHRKMHLWDAENSRFAKGEEIGVYRLPFATVGLLICYEIGFPEMARIQTLKGADVLLYSSAFGRARDYVWDIASRSRALENGVYVVACNRCGQEQDTSFGGLSRIVAPDASLLAAAEADGEAVVCAEIDSDEAATMRRTLPYLRDLHPKLRNEMF